VGSPSPAPQSGGTPLTAWQSLPVLVLVYGVIAISEEIGWRGYAQPRLAGRYGVLGGAVLLGLLLGLWHLPQWFIPATGQASRWPFPLFLAFMASLSVLFARLLETVILIGSAALVALVPPPLRAQHQPS
jgi:uncharacterized protein